MEYRLDITPRGSVTAVSVSQGDTGREIIFRLFNGPEELTLTDEAVSFISENRAIEDCTIRDGRAVLQTSEDMTANPGQYRAKLKLVTADGEINSAGFILEVEKRP